MITVKSNTNEDLTYVTDKSLYNSLVSEIHNGKTFTKNDLTYDILYELAIIENIADSQIGNIFNLSKNEIKYIRKKNNLQDKFFKKIIDHPEMLLNYMKQKGVYTDEISEQDWFKLIDEEIKRRVKNKDFNEKTYNFYMREKNIKNSNIDLANSELEFDIIAHNYKYSNSRKIKSNRSNFGRKVDQNKVNEAKIDSGKLGEKIVYDFEKKRLTNLGFDNLVKDIKWISKTENQNVTFDGLGYDIISFDENGEKIYIEVKTSSSTDNNKINFNISDKEVRFMAGKLNGIDKNKAYIYYVTNINKSLLIAEIIIINSIEFSKLELIPTTYKVSDIYKNNS